MHSCTIYKYPILSSFSYQESFIITERNIAKMLALSPSLFPTTHGWALEDLISQNLPHDCNEANSYNPAFNFHTFDQIKIDLPPEHSISSGETTNGGTGDEMMVVKKLNHNASERDRRKKCNELYVMLRSLLPISNDQKKKLSIPRTVSRVLQYIPELQKEVEILRSKKEKLLSYSLSTGNTRKEHSIRAQSAEDTTTKTKSSVASSVSILGDQEAVIQLISSADHMSKNKRNNLFSKVLDYLEQEEDELVLINATTFKSYGEGMLLSTLHLRVQGDHKIKAEKLKEKLNAFHQ
ncbi:putative transcription factor bHLH family [Helianthus annuus]|nr:putative transcription factor bHLH family [Helianthus annuus]KAJ0479834.1 putative transcription factor bHLH family [Helianthus annuus]KAJ0662666.1 putative transcription factor bHLH family [Helianthus annuus]KAJ0848031.1 putative transcription factor bHLH family [Helianthus annuus]